LIPLGWQEVANWESRMPIGWNPTDVDFNTVGKLGGEKEVRLLDVHFPPHDHYMFSDPNNSTTFDLSGSGNQNKYIRSTAGSGQGVGPNDYSYRMRGVNETANLGKTSKFGNSSSMATPHNNMPPYRVVMFIEPIPGYTGWQ
jgi:microcystin-dependent protein